MNVLTRRALALFVCYRDARRDDERTRLLAGLSKPEADGLADFFWQHRNRTLRGILRDLKVHPSAVSMVAKIIFETPRRGIVDGESESLIGVGVNELEARIRAGYLLQPKSEDPSPQETMFLADEEPESEGPPPEWIQELPADCHAGHLHRTLAAWAAAHRYSPLIYRMRDKDVAVVAKRLGIRITSVRNNITRVRMMAGLPTPTNYPPIDEQYAANSIAEALADALERLKVYDREREIIDHLLIRLGVTEGSYTARITQALNAVRCPRNCDCAQDAGTDANAG